jgi:hypothetical protein
VVVAALLATVLLVSVAVVIPYMTRGEPLPWAKAVIPPFLPKHFLSLILPYSFAELEYDQSVLFDGSNVYTGLLSLVFLVSGILQWKKSGRFFKRMILASVIFFLLSFGDGYGFYYVAYHYLPGFKYFRFPTMFRYFALLAMLTATAFAANDFLKNKSGNTLKIPLITVSVLIGGFFVVSIFHTGIFLKTGLPLYKIVTDFGFWDKVFVQSAIQLLIVVLLWFSLFYVKRKKHRITLALTVLFADLIIALNIYMPYTISSYKSDVNISNEILHKNIRDFSLENNANILENTVHPDSLYLFSKYLYIYQKRVSDNGVNSFKLTKNETFKKSRPVEYNVLINNPLFFFSNKENSKVELVDFGYNSISLTAATEDTNQFIFLQNSYYGWQATLDGQEVPVNTYNKIFMSVEVPPGKHNIVFSFRPKMIIYGFFVSLSFFVILLVLLIPRKEKG